MCPRAASRLESIGFEQVYDYVAGKADWGSAGLPLDGPAGKQKTGRAGDDARPEHHPSERAPPRRRGADAEAEADESPGHDLRRPARRTAPLEGRRAGVRAVLCDL